MQVGVISMVSLGDGTVVIRETGMSVIPEARLFVASFSMVHALSLGRFRPLRRRTCSAKHFRFEGMVILMHEVYRNNFV